jgi:DNA-binding transcriptional MerR regulator
MPRRMRMAELSRLSGVPRETIHYYAREGLLPPPERAGKTSAFYDESHLERLQLIRKLREEKYLPVAVIRRILEVGLEAQLGSDVDTLADVLAIDAMAQAASGPAPDPESVRVAVDLGLVGPTPVDVDDPVVRRVIGVVSQALELGTDARELTLADMAASREPIRQLVQAEAGAFFDHVVERGDVPAAVRALQRGRSAVARFIAAYRELALRNIIDELLDAVRSAPQHVARATALPLSRERASALGADETLAALRRRADHGDAAAANDWGWLCFSLRPPEELAAAPPALHARLRPRAQLLLAHARLEGGGDPRQLSSILERAGGFPLGEVLTAEVALLEALAPARGGVLERSVPALHRLFAADPGADADPLASAWAFLRRGLVVLALPRALGRTSSAERDLEQALSVVGSAPGRLHEAVRARIEGNARLRLGERWLALGRSSDAAEQLARARDLDPIGPIGQRADAVFLEHPEMLAESRRPR